MADTLDLFAGLDESAPSGKRKAPRKGGGKAPRAGRRKRQASGA